MDGVKVLGLLTLSIPLFVMVTSCYYSKQQHQQQHFEEEKEKETEKEEEQEQEQVKAAASVCWAELDWDVLGEILGRLSLTDQARFRAVCTNWLVASNSVLKTKSLPWHGCHYPCSSEFQIYDPLSSPNHLASRQIITWSDFGIQSPDYLNVIGIKHNWLILSLTKPNSFDWIQTNQFDFWNGRYVLLFSPLTKRIITLPKFDYPGEFQFAATFSTHPDSQDCVFCLVDNHQVDQIHVLTYRYGDKEWTATQFDRDPDLLLGVFTPHIISGILYITSPFGGLASYNILNGEFNVDHLLQNFYCRTIRSFVLNGELMILCYDLDVKKDAAAIRGQHFIRRYDRLSKVWIPVTTLADYALFFSPRFINVSLINTKDDTTCNRVLPNKVYRFFNGGCLVYSLEDGRLVEFKSINSNLLEDGGDNLPEYKYNYAFPETDNGFWLEAPRVRSSSDNQEVLGFRDEGKQGTVTNQNFLVRFCMGISKCNIF